MLCGVAVLVVLASWLCRLRFLAAGRMLPLKLGLNEFSDMSMDEFKMSKLGMMPESIWGNVPSGGVHKVSNVSLPKSVDWRSKAVTAVKNQKSRLQKDCALP